MNNSELEKLETELLNIANQPDSFIPATRLLLSALTACTKYILSGADWWSVDTIVRVYTKILERESKDREGPIMRNSMAKRRHFDSPYEIWGSSDGWKYKVLKKYQVDDNKPGARWLVVAYNPNFSAWSGESDAYVNSIKGQCTRIYVDPTIQTNEA